jgi:hypothetical protein
LSARRILEENSNMMEGMSDDMLFQAWDTSDKLFSIDKSSNVSISYILTPSYL